jgi:hypothetical protein
VGIQIAVTTKHQKVKRRRALLIRIFTILLIGLALSMMTNSDCFSDNARAQQSKIPKEPLQVTDASTGKLIPEFFVIPRYSSFTGTSTLLGEGPGRGTDRNYLAKPFIYRTGDPFVLRLPKSIGVGLPGFIFIGKGRSIDGVLVVATRYRPMWFTRLWSIGSERKLQLTPISGNEWSLLVEKALSPLEKGVLRISDGCSFWGLPEQCTLEVHFNKKERQLVRSFLQQARSGPK